MLRSGEGRTPSPHRASGPFSPRRANGLRGRKGIPGKRAPSSNRFGALGLSQEGPNPLPVGRALTPGDSMEGTSGWRCGRFFAETFVTRVLRSSMVTMLFAGCLHTHGRHERRREVLRDLVSYLKSTLGYALRSRVQKGSENRGAGHRRQRAVAFG